MGTNTPAEDHCNAVSGAKSFATRFLLTMLLVTVGVCVAGWCSDLRDVAHGALLAVAAFAFLPFVIIALGIGLIGLALVISLAAAIFGGGGDVGGGGGDEVVAGGIAAIPGYYRFLSRQRHPVFWGMPAGALFGGICLWGFVAVTIIPRETSTAEMLIGAQSAIEETFQRTSRYPTPTDAGHLLLRSIGQESAPSDAILLDAFGRPVVYKKWGHWKVATYSLHSNGYDGVASKDDLCRSGGTKLGRYAQMIEINRSGPKRRLSVSIRLGSVLESRCGEHGS